MNLNGQMDRQTDMTQTDRQTDRNFIYVPILYSLEKSHTNFGTQNNEILKIIIIEKNLIVL